MGDKEQRQLARLGSLFGNAVRACTCIDQLQAAIRELVAELGAKRAERVLARATESKTVSFPAQAIARLEWCKLRLELVPVDADAAYELGLLRAFYASNARGATGLAQDELDALLTNRPSSFTPPQIAEYMCGLLNGSTDDNARCMFRVAYFKARLQLNPNDEHATRSLANAESESKERLKRNVVSLSSGNFDKFITLLAHRHIKHESPSQEMPS